jgi:integrase
MAERINFTKAALESLIEGRDGARAVIYDAKQPGLIAELRAGGTLSFYLYRWANGRPHRLRIGAYPAVTIDAARQQARELTSELANGADPAEAKRAKRQEATLADLLAHWLDYAKQHKKTWQADETLYKRLLVGWKTRRLSSIKRSDIAALHARIGRDNGPYIANRLLALIRAMFNKANDVGFEGTNPTKGIKKFKEQSRDRFLQPDEMPRFMAALNAEPNDTLRDFFLLCLYTGARKGNVQAMAWEEVNLAAATWRIPDTKSGEPVTVHLSAPAMEILARRVLKANGCTWVFPYLPKR